MLSRLFTLSWNMAYLAIYIFMIFYFLQSKKTYIFVKGIFITGCSFRIIAIFLDILMRSFNISAIETLFGWDGRLVYINSYLSFMGFFLLAFGICFLIGRGYDKGDRCKEYPIMKGNRRNIGITLLLFVITLGVYFPFWLYRTVKDLKNNFGVDIPYTPGKAVGFLFIPVFNIFWFFYILFSLPLRMKRIEEKYFGENVGFYFHPVLIPIVHTIFLISSNLHSFIIQVEGITFLDKSIVDIQLFFISVFIVLLLTLHAKLNAFFDFRKDVIENDNRPNLT